MRIRQLDVPLLVTTITLVAFGIMMVFSASYSYALSNMGNGMFFLTRIIRWALIGAAAMSFFAFLDYRIWKKLSNTIMVFSFILLVVVLTEIGTEINQAKRWIHVAGFSVMPSEIAKFAVILFMAASLERKKQHLHIFTQGILPYLFLGAACFFLIYRQPDFSTAVVLLGIIMVMLFVGGVRITHFLVLFAGVAALAGSFLLYVFASGQGYKTRRLAAYLDPWADPSDAGLQAIQSLLAIGSGGLTGKGIGNGIQKHLHLPEPHNDFIFSIIAEEMGFLGSVFLIVLFSVFVWRCTRIAVHAPDYFSCLVASGVAALVSIQVVINIGVATSLLPVTGIPLPFISYGGNALAVLMALTGILLNISMHANYHPGG